MSEKDPLTISPEIPVKPVQRARKSFPKPKASISNAKNAMEGGENTVSTPVSKDKPANNGQSPDKVARSTPETPTTKPNTQGVSIQEHQKNILAEMRKRYLSPNKVAETNATPACLPTSTTEPVVSDTSEAELIPLCGTPDEKEKLEEAISPRPSDETKANVPDYDGSTHPPTPAPTPHKEEELNVEAAMAALHGETLDDSYGVTSSAHSVKISPISKPKVHIKSPVKEAELPSEAPVLEIASSLKELDTPPPASEITQETPTKQSKQIEKAEVTSVSSKGARKSRLSRELESLYIDEGAINILEEMKVKQLVGHSRRRVAVTFKDFDYGSYDDQSPSPRHRSDVKQDSEPERKKKKTAQTKNEMQQDKALENWQAVPSTKNKKKVVYTPRPNVKLSSSESEVESSPLRKKRKGTEPDVKDSHTTNQLKGSAGLPSSRLTDTRATDKVTDEYKEILLSYKDALLHIIICPVSTTLHNSFNIPVLKELISLFKKLKSDTKTQVVLITSAGPDFCKGVDLPSIINCDPTIRSGIITETVECIREFFIELANCDKWLIGGVNGKAIGLGVAMLPYLDVTYASDKAIFYLPYAALKQCTEGGVGYACRATSKGEQAFNLMLCEGCKLTADQACQMGLISSVLGLSSFSEALMPHVLAITSQSCEALLASKRIKRSSTWNELPSVLELECNQLFNDWSSDNFVIQAERFLDQDFIA